MFRCLRSWRKFRRRSSRMSRGAESGKPSPVSCLIVGQRSPWHAGPFGLPKYFSIACVRENSDFEIEFCLALHSRKSQEQGISDDLRVGGWQPASSCVLWPLLADPWRSSGSATSQDETVLQSSFHRCGIKKKLGLITCTSTFMRTWLHPLASLILCRWSSRVVAGHQPVQGKDEISFKCSDSEEAARLVLEEQRDHLLAAATSEFLKQECKVDTLNTCILDFQRQAHSNPLEMDYVNYGYEESRREQARLHEEFAQTEKALRETRIRSIHEVEDLKRAQEKCELTNSPGTLR